MTLIVHRLIDDLTRENERLKKQNEIMRSALEEMLYQHVGKDKANSWNFTAISSNDNAIEALSQCEDNNE